MEMSALCLVVLVVALAQLRAVACQSLNRTCTASDIESVLTEQLTALKLAADDLVVFHERKIEAPERAAKVWNGSKGKMNLSLYKQKDLRAPMEVYMSGEGSRLMVDVVVRTGGDGEKEQAHWREGIEQAWLKRNKENLCEMSLVSMAMTKKYNDGANTDLLRCIACFSVLGLALPILYNLVLGYGFSAACQAKGYDETTCDEFSIDLVMALELPIIFVSALQVFERCVKKEDFCQNASTASALLPSSL